MPVTLGPAGVTFSDGTTQTSAATGGVTFGSTQYTGYSLVTYGGPSGLGVPATGVVVGADTVKNTSGPPGQRRFDSTSMRFRYKVLS